MRQALFSCVLALTACRGPNSQVILVVDAQPGVREQALGLHVRIFGGPRDIEDVPAEPVHEVIEPIEDRQGFWPRTYALAPASSDAGRLYRFEAIGRRGPRADDLEVVSARVISGYQQGEIVYIRLLLTDACIGIPCEDPRFTCDPATRMCSMDARRDPDGPFDPEAGVPDGGSARPCTADVDCDDRVACTEDICTSSGTCGYYFHNDRCADAHACTEGYCLTSGCQQVTNDALCDDSVSCTRERCTLDGCAPEPDDTLCTAGSGGRCDELADCQYDECVIGTTCTMTSDCQFPPMCDAGGACVRQPRCGIGPCCHGECTSCDDGNPCTTDRCGAAGCENVPNTESCDDGNGCTVGDRCADRVCNPGTPRTCNDMNQCTTDPPCNASTGMCPTPVPRDNLPCDNGDGCPGDTCAGSTCMPNDCDMDAGSAECLGSADCPASADPCEYPICADRMCLTGMIGGCVGCGGSACVGECCGASNCCPPGGECCGDGRCCGPGTTCCGAACCNDATQMCRSGLCVPLGSMCSPSCMPGTQTCCWNGASYYCQAGAVCPTVSDGGTPIMDAGTDAGWDAGRDAGTDAGRDGGRMDAGVP